MRLNGGGVDTNSDIPNHALCHIDPIGRNDTDHGVIAVGEAVAKDAIHRVGGPVDLGVLGIRREGHDLLLQGLVKVELAGRDDVARGDGPVAAEDPVVVDLDVDVDGTLDVEAGEDGLHLHHAVGVGGPHAAQERGVVGVEVGHADVVVGDVEVLEELHEGGVGVQGREARVAARGVAVPHVDHDTLEGLTGVHIQNTNIQSQWYADLVLGHILTESLAINSYVLVSRIFLLHLFLKSLLLLLLWNPGGTYELG